MKKFLALALAILMMAAIAVPAFAAEFETQESEPVQFEDTLLWEETRYGNGNDNSSETNYLTDANDQEEENTKIEYGVAQAYTVTIPAEIHLHEFHATSGADGTVEGGKKDGYVYGIEKLGVSDVVIAGDETLNIYLSSSQWDPTTDATKGWTLKDAETGANNVTNNKDNTAGPSADVNYKIKAKDITVDAQGNDEVDTAQYITDYDSVSYGNADDKLIASGTGADVAASRILTQAAATGNAGTTGSGKTAFLYFSSKGTAQEGTFRDILTFTVKIEKNA